ncbi:ComEC/Rec2 family competence protein [Arthrobacter sp. GMC3]|uniref:ComEC/Rec2 family competence protein n=1 Tax=Arthrobacter sp. GMC3 TaxID=2058894 RepID=UPI000CE4088F|nr:ComEC/Rec2 family competence protein [Arthrobacter sp. GMC3]
MNSPRPRWAHFATVAVVEPEPGEVKPPPARIGGVVSARLAASLRDASRPRDAGHRPRPDLRLVPAVVAVWAGAAFSIGTSWRVAAGGAGLCLVAGIILGWILCRRYRLVAGASQGTGVMATALVAAVCLGTLLAAVGLRLHDRERSPLVQAVTQGESFNLTMRLTSTPRALTNSRSQQQVIFDAVVLEATARGQNMKGPLSIQVIAGAQWAQLPEGTIASTAGTIAPARDRDGSGGFLRPATGPLRVRAPSDSLARQMRTAWAQASQRMWSSLSPDTAGLLPGMVMGDRSAVPPALSEAMKTVGLSHLTAVSGANCTLVLAAFVFGLRTVHLPRGPTAAGAVAGLAGFVAVVGPDPSVLRAAVMGGIGCLAVLSGQPKRVGALLSVSIIGLLVFDPWLSMDYAFILSVLATLGLHLLGRRCALWLGVWMPWWLAQALAIPLAAQLFCGPVIVLLAPRLTLFTVPANMVVAPVVALVTTAGTFGMAVAPWWPWLAHGCAAMSGVGAWWVAVVARWMAGLPGASLPWPDGARGVILMALMNLAVILALLGLVERRRLVLLVIRARNWLPPGLRFLLGFPFLAVASAGGAALWTLAVLGP